ncbi:MAG: hypothetical protein WDO71_26195 [Bacteroidota bacterium]
MHILDTIVAAKRKEIAKYKPLSSIERFKQEGFFWGNKQQVIGAKLVSGE